MQASACFATVGAEAPALRTCSRASVAATGCHSAPAPNPATEKKPAAPLQAVRLTHPGADKVVVGTGIDATAEGLPPGRKVDLLWKTVNGGWVIEDYFHFRGKKFTETSTVARDRPRPTTTAGSSRISQFPKTTAASTSSSSPTTARRSRRAASKSLRHSRSVRPKDPSARRSRSECTASAGGRWRARG